GPLGAKWSRAPDAADAEDRPGPGSAAAPVRAGWARRAPRLDPRSGKRKDPQLSPRVLTRCSKLRAVAALGYRPNVGRLRALGPIGDVELDLLVLLEVTVSRTLDRAEVHEHVGTFLLGDEAEALLGAEPLHGASRHEQFPPFLGRVEPACCSSATGVLAGYARELLVAKLPR